MLRTLTRILGLCLAALLLGVPASGQSQGSSAPSYSAVQAFNPRDVDINFNDEYLFRLLIQHVAYVDMTVYSVDSVLYLPFQEFFSFLRIKNELTDNGNILKGFFLSQERIYEIDLKQSTMVLGDSLYSIAPRDLLMKGNVAHFSLDFFRRYFSMDFDVRFESLSILIKSTAKFPIVRILQREQVRQQRPGQVYAPRIDKTLPREYHWIDGAMLNWSLSYVKNAQMQFGTYGANLGLEVLGGDLQGSINGSTNRRLNLEQIPWRWRFVKDEYPYFRQATVGDYLPIFGRSYSAKGVTVSNQLLYTRTNFGTHTFRGKTKPGWDVECYIDQKLAGYTVADAEGSYTFELPLRYGALMYTMMHYGPNGEEEVEEGRIDVPQSLLPPSEIEYSLTIGELNAYKGRLHSQFLASYGLSGNVTFGVGFQNFKIGDATPSVPAATLSARMPWNTLFQALHIQNIQTTLGLSHVTVDDSRIGIGVTRYYSHPMNPGALRWQGQVNGAVRPRFLGSNTQLSIVAGYNGTTMDDMGTMVATISGQVARIFAAYSFRGSLAWTSSSSHFSSESMVNLWSIISGRYFVNGMMSWDHSSNSPNVVQLGFSTALFNRIQMSVGTTWNFRIHVPSAQLDLQIPLDFTTTTTRALYSNNTYTFSQSAFGSMGFDSKTGEFLFTPLSWVGRSAISILPFLDENGNAQKDEGESLMESEVRAISEKGQTHGYLGGNYSRVVNLEQYTPTIVQIDSSSLRDPIWLPRFKTFRLEADPNQFKPLYLPIYYASQASGSVMAVTAVGFEGVKDLKVHFRGLENQFSDFTVTFSDGTFDYFGLPPGKYTAYPDERQLEQMEAVTYPSSFYFELKSKPEGDVVGRINFLLKQSKVPLLVQRQDTIRTEEPLAMGDQTPRRQGQDVAGIPDTATMRMMELEMAKLQPMISLIDTTSENRSIIIPDTAFVALETAAIDSTLLRPSFALIDTIRTLAPVPTVVARDIPPEIGSVTAPVLPQTQSIPINLALRDLDTSATNMLDRIAATVKGRRNYIIRIEGHSDSFGSLAESQTRSQERADRATNYLVKKGIPRRNIQVQAFGSRRPIAPNTTAAGRARNNRVDIIVILQ